MSCAYFKIKHKGFDIFVNDLLLLVFFFHRLQRTGWTITCRIAECRLSSHHRWTLHGGGSSWSARLHAKKRMRLRSSDWVLNPFMRGRSPGLSDEGKRCSHTCLNKFKSFHTILRVPCFLIAGLYDHGGAARRRGPSGVSCFNPGSTEGVNALPEHGVPLPAARLASGGKTCSHLLGATLEGNLTACQQQQRIQNDRARSGCGRRRAAGSRQRRRWGCFERGIAS